MDESETTVEHEETNTIALDHKESDDTVLRHKESNRTLAKIETHDKRFKRILKVFGFLLAIAILFNIWFATLIIRDSWDPLSTYPVQTVTNPQTIRIDVDGRTTTYPTIRVSGDIDVAWPTVNIDATKCANEEVNIKGQSSWKQVEPPGFISQEVLGFTKRNLGCQLFHYRNDFPPEVKGRIEKLANEGVTKTIWQITGEEIPVRDDGKTGRSRIYQSQNFMVVYGDE
jgi:hypothetical protein